MATRRIREHGSSSQPSKYVYDLPGFLRNYFRCTASLYQQIVRSYGKEALLVSCCAVCTECTVLHNYSAYKIEEHFKVSILYFKTEEFCNQEIKDVD